MRYGTFWQNYSSHLRLLGFGLLLLLSIIAGLNIRHLRHSTPTTNNLQTVFTAIRHDVQQNFGGYVVADQEWPMPVGDNNPQHVKDYQFTLSSTAQPTLVIGWAPTGIPVDSLQAVSTGVQDTLQKLHFTKQQALSSLPGLNDQQSHYTRGQYSCTVGIDATETNVLVQCTSLEEQQARAAQAQPFVDDYLATHPDVRPQDVIFGQLSIKSQDQNNTVIGHSPTAGYDVAEAVLYRPGAATGTLALFYEHNGQWQYITESRMDERGFSCSAIENDPQASKAYLGNPCFDVNLQQVRSSGVTQ